MTNLSPARLQWPIALLYWKLAFASAAPAPATLSLDLAELSLEELASIKVSSVYSASKHEQKVSEAPSSVSIVTSDEIKKSGYRTLADILNGVRGFYITYDRSYSYIGVRGFNRPGDYGGRVLVMVDGHRINDPIYDSGFNGTEFILDVDLIDRVEIIRGPGSSLYGNNALFAVINVITRAGRDLQGAEVAGAYASYDTYTGRLSYGNRFHNGVELRLSGTYFDSAGHDRLFYPEFIGVNRGMAEHLDGTQAGSGFAAVGYGDFSLEGAYVKRIKEVPTAAYGTVFNDPRNDILDERAFAELKYHHQFGEDWEVLSRIYYDHYRYESHDPLPEFAYGDALYPGQIVINRDFSNSESAGGEVQGSMTLLERNRVTAGVEYRHDFTLDLRNYDQQPPATYVDARLRADTVGVYLQDELTVRHNLILNAGVRYDYFSSFGDTVNPRAALIYSPWTNTTFKAIYGQAFRAPNAFELYYEAPGYSANPNVGPETIRSYKVVYEQAISPEVRLTSSLFYNEIDHLITFQTDESGTNVIFGNVAGATAWGGDIELEARLRGGWHGRVSYTYADARDADSEEPLSNSPAHLAKASLTAPLWREKVFATLEILGMSERTTVQGHRVSGFWIANATLFSRELIKGLEASASVYNLLDQRYADPVGADFTQDTIEQDGRTFRVKLTYRF